MRARMVWGCALLVGLSVPAADAQVERVCRLPAAITESSGLVVSDRQLITTNDSGDAGTLYVLNDSCALRRTLQWGTEATDVEALAPGPGGSVWVGDIGDNAEERSSIDVWLVRVSDGALLRHRRLVYPDGAHDAEALWVDGTGVLYVATKGLLGGAAYRVPERGERLRRIGRTPGLVTDAALLDDERVALRTYSDLVVFTLDPWREVARVELPRQPQGEALAFSGGQLWVTSEGDREPVLRFPIPKELLVAQPLKPTPGEPPPSADVAEDETRTTVAPEETDLDWRWLWPAGAIALTVAVWWMARRVRR